MKKSIIKSLYNGNPPPAGAGFENDVNYGNVFDKISKLEDYLKTKLEENEHEKLQDLETLQSEVVAIETDKSFKHGFCIAALLMIEIFTAENLLGKAENE